MYIVLIVDPLLVEWSVLDKFWQVLRGILCWQIWKNQNKHFLADKRSDSVTVIYKSWRQLGIYIRLEWSSLIRKFRLGKTTFGDAELAMQSQFGSNPAIWNLLEMVLQVPPVPQ